MYTHRSRHLSSARALSALILLLGHATARADPPRGGETKATAPGSTPGTADRASEEASTRFQRGLQLFDEGDYTLALVEFERAYQLAPNYRALYNIALVDIQLARYADVARTLETYLRDGGDAIGAARRAEVIKKLGELKL